VWICKGGDKYLVQTAVGILSCWDEQRMKRRVTAEGDRLRRDREPLKTLWPRIQNRSLFCEAQMVIMVAFPGLLHRVAFLNPKACFAFPVLDPTLKSDGC
jgi:hypothetical protein